MEFINENLQDLDIKKQKLGNLLNKDYGLKEDAVNISILNVDSYYREKKPKNILESTGNNILLEDPIITSKDSSVIKITYPNHNLMSGDMITLNNVTGINKTLSNAFYLINNFNYLLIKMDNHDLPINYTSYVDNIEIDIQLVSTISSNSNTTTRFYNNIPINMLLGLKKVLLLDDIESNIFDISTIVEDNIFDYFSDINTVEDIRNNFIFIELDFLFSKEETELSNVYKINHIYNIRLMQLNGLYLTKINADYPLNHDRHQGYHQVINTTENMIEVNINGIAYSDGNSGGSNVTIFKIQRTTQGYPNAGEFVLNLRKNFTNVVRIEMVSSEFPFTEFIIEEGKNNKLYWQHLDDGDKVYSISIPSGNYSASNLIQTISTEMNNVQRINYTPENRVLNKFEIELNTFTSKIEFKAFTETLLPNSINQKTIFINNKEYYQLDIEHPNNFVEVGDVITISNSEAIGDVPKTSINSSHVVYKIEKTDETYSILLNPFNKTTGSEYKGGSSVKITTVAKVRFLFDRQDTLGDILGFKNSGGKNSITPFKSIISNFDEYIYPNDLDSVGNKSIINNLLQLNGRNNYWLLYMNNLESVILNNGLESCFAKILLSGSHGDIIYNSFVNSPIEFDKPIPTISDITIKVTDSKGNMVDFENTDFSFTIRIYELISKPKGTGKVSNETSFIKELIEKIDKRNL